MFGLSLAELFIVFLAAILFIKPNDLPALIKTLSSLISKLKRLVRVSNKEYVKLKSEIKNEYGDEFFENIDDINSEVKEIIGDDGKTYKAFDFDQVEMDIKDSLISDDSK